MDSSTVTFIELQAALYEVWLYNKEERSPGGQRRLKTRGHCESVHMVTQRETT